MGQLKDKKGQLAFYERLSPLEQAALKSVMKRREAASGSRNRAVNNIRRELRREANYDGLAETAAAFNDLR